MTIIYIWNKVANKIPNWPTCKPLPIMRLTALLPPPPMPTTLILALSTYAYEHLTEPKRRRWGAILVVLGLMETEVVSALWWNVEEQESERSSLGFLRGWSFAIFFLSVLSVFLMCFSRVLRLNGKLEIVAYD